MKPLAKALNILQSESRSHFGYLYIVCVELRSYFAEFKRRTYRYCGGMVPLLEKSLDSRYTHFLYLSLLHFSDLFSFLIPSLFSIVSDMYLAAALHPILLVKYPTLKNKCISYIHDLEEECLHQHRPVSPTAHSSDDSPFFVHGESQSHDCGYLAYLSSPSFENLKTMPCVKRAFLKYNTPITSSACIERCFSSGKATLRFNRPRLGDRIASQLVVSRIGTKSVRVH